MLLYQLSTVWAINSQYAHGFLVPFLLIFLILKIEPQEVENKNFFHSKKTLLIYLLGIPLLLSIIPIWITRGANSDWRLINLALFLCVSLLSFLHLSFLQNKNFKIRQFIFPILFFLVAIPWPLSTDLKLTQWLQGKISSMIVDALLLLGHEAILEGTVIDIGVFGKVGVDQACSGINGLQSSLVVSLFVGAYYSFPIIHRFLLVIGGGLIALFFNLSRAFSLSIIKVKGFGHYLDQSPFAIGEFNFPNLHDMVGIIETGLIFLSILLLARLSRGGLFLTTLGTTPYRLSNLYFAPPIGLSICSLVVVISTILGTELHYSLKEKVMLPLPELTLILEDNEITISEEVIPQQIKAQLHFQTARSVQWQDRFRSRWNPFGYFEINPNSEYWQAFHAKWNSGGACTAVLSTHSPDSCLPLTGLTQINPLPGQDPILVPIKISEREVLFEAYEFSRNFRKLFVFRCFWPHKLSPGQPNLFPRGGYNFNGRINSALEGRRNVGGAMIALAIANVESSQVALSKLQSLAIRRLSFSE
ncbi:MAG: exosortase/archaeosortase family protein [Verrucomicrobiota bacterium]|nr:exosortase/archaeosortase family protein [Verrucomicrobiota bacterium]